jgi:hypothetical protein
LGIDVDVLKSPCAANDPFDPSTTYIRNRPSSRRSCPTGIPLKNRIMVTIRWLFEFICVKGSQNGGYLRTIHDTIVTAFFAPHTAHRGASNHDDALSPSPPLRRIPPAGQYRPRYQPKRDEVIRQATAKDEPAIRDCAQQAYARYVPPDREKTCTDGCRLPGADRCWSRLCRCR